MSARSTLSPLQIEALWLVREQRFFTESDLRHMLGGTADTSRIEVGDGTVVVMLTFEFRGWDWKSHCFDPRRADVPARIRATFSKDGEGLLTGEVEIGFFPDGQWRTIALEHLKGL